MTDAQRVVPVAGEPELLKLYLNDHLAGSMAGLALARRLAAGHFGTAAAERLDTLAVEIEEDRVALVAIMSALGIRPMMYKGALAVVAERLARLKPNGHLRSRSPLSSLLELEGMRLGVEGKAACWRSLRALSDNDPRLDQEKLDELVKRARAQIQMLERLRMRAAVEALSDEV